MAKDQKTADDEAVAADPGAATHAVPEDAAVEAGQPTAEQRRDARAQAEAKRRKTRFPVSQLIRDADQVFGVPGHAVAGAFHGDEREDLTLAEAQKLIDTWYGR